MVWIFGFSVAADALGCKVCHQQQANREEGYLMPYIFLGGLRRHYSENRCSLRYGFWQSSGGRDIGGWGSLSD